MKQLSEANSGPKNRVEPIHWRLAVALLVSVLAHIAGAMGLASGASRHDEGRKGQFHRPDNRQELSPGDKLQTKAEKASVQIRWIQPPEPNEPPTKGKRRPTQPKTSRSRQADNASPNASEARRHAKRGEGRQGRFHRTDNRQEPASEARRHAQRDEGRKGRLHRTDNRELVIPGLSPVSPQMEGWGGLIVGLPGRSERDALHRKTARKAPLDAYTELEHYDTGRFKLRPQKDGSLRYTEARFGAVITRFGDVIFEVRSPGALARTYQIVSELDISSMLHEAGAMDLARYQKRAFMLETAELRSALRAKAVQRTLENTARATRERLSLIWSSKATIEQKKKTIFQLWDECLENDPNPKRIEAAKTARRTVLEFIRLRLPKDDPQGYSPAELVALNRSRSSQSVFDPYP